MEIIFDPIKNQRNIKERKLSFEKVLYEKETHD